MHIYIYIYIYTYIYIHLLIVLYIIHLGLPTGEWTSYGTTGHEYYLSTGTSIYTDAITACETIDSQLVRLADQDTADALYQAFGVTYVIDLNDIDTGNLPYMYP